MITSISNSPLPLLLPLWPTTASIKVTMLETLTVRYHFFVRGATVEVTGML
jgi:hypothetical protein